ENWKKPTKIFLLEKLMLRRWTARSNLIWVCFPTPTNIPFHKLSKTPIGCAVNLLSDEPGDLFLTTSVNIFFFIHSEPKPMTKKQRSNSLFQKTKNPRTNDLKKLPLDSNTDVVRE